MLVLGGCYGTVGRRGVALGEEGLGIGGGGAFELVGRLLGRCRSRTAWGSWAPGSEGRRCWGVVFPWCEFNELR